MQISVQRVFAHHKRIANKTNGETMTKTRTALRFGFDPNVTSGCPDIDTAEIDHWLTGAACVHHF